MAFLDFLFGDQAASGALPTMGDAPAAGGGGMFGAQPMTPLQYSLLGAASRLGQLASVRDRKVGAGELLGAAASGMMEGRMAGTRAAEQQEDRKMKRELLGMQKDQLGAKTAQMKRAADAQAAFRATLPEEEQSRFDVDPIKYLEQNAPPKVLTALRAASKYQPGTLTHDVMMGDIFKSIADGGFVYGPSGATAVPGGPADPRYIQGKAGAEAAGKHPYDVRMEGIRTANDIQKAWLTPRERNPGSVEVTGGSPAGGAPVTETYRNPNPAPGTQEGAWQKGLGEWATDRFKAYGTEAANARGIIDSAQQLETLFNKGFTTGWGTQFKSDLANALQGMGISKDVTQGVLGVDPANTARFNQVIGSMVMDKIGSLGAGFSNADRDFVLRQLPMIADPQKATEAAVKYLRDRATNAIERHSLATDLMSKGASSADMLRFDSEWNKRFGLQPGAPAAAAAQPRIRVWNQATGKLE